MAYESGRGGGVLVRVPNSLATTVNITAASGRAITVYTDVARSVTVAMPDAVTADKTYYLDRDDSYVISLKVNGVEAGVSGTTGTPATKNIGEGRQATFTIDRELAELAVTTNASASYLTVQEGPLSPYRYGAIGDGGTDETAAFTAINAALPASGGEVYGKGAFYLPNGFAFTKPVKLRGAGAGDLTLAAPTKIVTDGAAVTALDFQADGCIVEDLLVVCTAATPVAGSRGIKFTKGILAKLRGVHVAQFYDNIDFIDGSYWQIVGGMSLDPVNYALKINSLQGSGDWGDPVVQGMHFGTKNLTRSPAAAIRYESGGGLKISSIKVVSGFNTLYRFVRGLDVVMAAGTSVLTMAGSSIEGCTDRQVSISTSGTGAFSKVSITGNEFLGANTSADGIVVGAPDSGHANSVRDVLIAANVMYSLNRGIYAQHMKGLTVGVNEFSPDNVGASTVAHPVYIDNDVAGKDVARQSYGNSVAQELLFDNDAAFATANYRLGTVTVEDTRDTNITTANTWLGIQEIDLPTSGSAVLSFTLSGMNWDAGNTSRTPFVVKQTRGITRDQGGSTLTATLIGTDFAMGTNVAEVAVRFRDKNSNGQTLIVEVQSTSGATHPKIFARAKTLVEGQVQRFYRS